ncbi:MAG TPA: hypothetical protein VL404_05745 [Candidatus Eisenbacteria bacterium]|nr:hypothetical protein [Candidatus Eisenbacteria bacterium]
MKRAPAAILAVALLSAAAARADHAASPQPLTDEAQAFRRAVSANGQDMNAYETLVRALEDKHHLDRGDMSVFMRTVSSVLGPGAGQEYHYLGLALYDRGHDEEAQAVLEVYQKGKMSVSEAVDKVREVVDASKAVLPPATTARLEAGTQKLEATQAQTRANLDRVTLKNGQSLYGHVVEEEGDGIWFEMDEGTKMLLKNDEIKVIQKGGAS